MRKLFYISLIILCIHSCDVVYAQHTTAAGISIIKYYEGFRPVAYKCPSGIWTIFYGHTGNDVHSGMIGTRQQGEIVLEKDLIKFENYTQKTINRNLKWHEFDAIVCFSFNVGFRFSPGEYYNATLKKAIDIGNTNLVVMQLNKYSHDKYGRVLSGLVKRRKSECALYSDDMGSSFLRGIL